MSFRFALGRAQVKLFKTALHTLNKIGGELLVEAIPQQLVLRSINTAKSAFLSVTYFSPFFDSYAIYDTLVIQTVLLSKNVLSIFRSQKINQIEFVLDNATARLQATVHTDEGLIKRYAFNCLDGEVLQANVDRDAYPTVVVAEAAELDKLLSSFQHTLDEISLIAYPLSAVGLANGHRACEIRSFVDPMKGEDSALVTSMALDTRSVFTSYHHSSQEAADVTFNVKDFRSMAALCTALGADVALRMETAGAPLVVEPHFRGLREGSGADFQAMLVLSTLTDTVLTPEDQHPQQQPIEQQQPQQQQLQQGGPAAEAEEPEGDEPPDPYGAGVGAAAGGAQGGGAYGATSGVARDSGGGRGRGGGRTAGRGRCRLPARQVDGDEAATVPAVAMTTTARWAYAAAAAAEGLPADGGAAHPAKPPAGPPPCGWAGPGPDDSIDGAEDEVPARRTGRPARFDTAHLRMVGAAAATVGGRGGVAQVEASVHPGHPHSHTQGQPHLEAQQPLESLRQHQQQQQYVPADPRVGAQASGAWPQQEPYVQFPPGTGAVQSAATSPHQGDSQDPECLPGMRSPYGRQDQPHPGSLLEQHQHKQEQKHQQQFREVEEGAEPEGQPDITHAELFGEDDAGEDDDDEVPATPPEQRQTKSMGAGVLGLGDS